MTPACQEGPLSKHTLSLGIARHASTDGSSATLIEISKKKCELLCAIFDLESFGRLCPACLSAAAHQTPLISAAWAAMQYAVGPHPTLAIRAANRLYEAVIGMEIHAQIRIATKLMSPAPADTEMTAAPNTRVHPIDAGYPGMMPVLSRSAVRQAVRTGIAFDGNVQRVSAFDRKHYFYSDLPVGYQITQWQHPIVTGGSVHTRVPLRDPITGGKLPQGAYDSCVRLERIQLEQDSGRSVHTLAAHRSLVDLNRAGVALMEIVTEPDMRSPDEAGAFVRATAAMLRHIGTCDGQMENGSLRADVNVSVREYGSSEFGERVEMKNLNSVRSVERAVQFEVDRQTREYETIPLIAPPLFCVPVEAAADSVAAAPALADVPLGAELLESYTPSAPDMAWGQGAVQRETRSFNAATGATARLRGKEDAMDYRFMPEPDLPPLILPKSFIKACGSSLPPLPRALVAEYTGLLGLTRYDADVIVGEPGGPRFFKALCKHVAQGTLQGEVGGATPPPSTPWVGDAAAVKQAQAKQCANWLCSELLGQLHAQGAELPASPVSPAALGDLVILQARGIVSGKIGKAVMELMLQQGGASEGGGDADSTTPLDIVTRNGWVQVTDADIIHALVQAVIKEDQGEGTVDDAMARWPADWQQAVQGGSAAPDKGGKGGNGKPRKKAPKKKKSSVEQWLATGNERLLGALVGRALSAAGGKPAPDLVSAELGKQLQALKDAGQ